MSLNYEQAQLAKRWCVLNCWSWPADVPLPANRDDRRVLARELMAKIVREIGLTRCLEYWNSDEFRAMQAKLEKMYE